MKFKVSRQESYDISIDDVAKSLADADTSVQCNFIAEFFGGMSKETVDKIAVKMSANGFHRGDKELEMLAAAVNYNKYKEGN